MCGIAGSYRLDGGPLDPHVLGRMTELLRHRGPDDEGYRLFSLRGGASVAWQPGSALEPGAFEGGLGFRRLSILDLSANGHQPMATPDGRVVLILNGEIYNAFDLRPELEADGVVFRSRSDTEVLLYLYVKHGIEGMLERLNGMFALCVVDLARREMHVVRDRLGIKPLYWYERDGAFLFASEVKAFLAHPAFRAEPDAERIDEYLSYRACVGDGFLLRGVRALGAGCRLRVRPEGIEERVYWRPSERAGEGPGPGARDALERLDEALRRSVRMQLLSDVKVGCQLSGGIDSTLVNLFATRYGAANMDAFSIVFDDPRIDERRWIEAAVRETGVVSHTSTLDAERFVEQLERATWHLDFPLNHPNAIGIWYVAEQARPIVTVLLSGEGADELFGGYYRYWYARVRERLGGSLAWLGRLPGLGATIADKFGDPRATDHATWFLAQSAFVRPDDVRALRPDARLEGGLARRRAVFEEGRGDFLANCLRYDLRTYLDPLLVRQDKMTMAHSVENRVPFLDHELVELVRGFPTDALVRLAPALRRPQARGTKVLLKRLARRYFDEEFVYRPKMGFEVPIRSFLAHPRFRALAEERLLPGMRRRGVVDSAVVERWWREDSPARSRRWDAIWSAMALELWAQQFLDGNPLEARPASRTGGGIHAVPRVEGSAPPPG